MLDRETVGYFLAYQDMILESRKTQYPEVDLQSTESPAQLESEKAWSSKELGQKVKP